MNCWLYDEGNPPVRKFTVIHAETPAREGHKQHLNHLRGCKQQWGLMTAFRFQERKETTSSLLSASRSATETGITHRTIQLLLADCSRRHHTKNQSAQPNCHISWSHSLSIVSFWKRWYEKQMFPFPPPKKTLKVTFKVRGW